jgi:hypothetical protein
MYYKFVNHDVKPATPEFFTREKILEKFKNGITFNYDLFRNGCIKSGGWCYDFTDELRKFLVKQYGDWCEYYAPNKTLLCRGLYGRIDKIIEIDVNIEQRAQKTLLKALKNALSAPDVETMKTNIKAIINFVDFGCQND